MDIKEKLKEVMRSTSQSVVVITFQTKHGPHGLTVSSFISVSLNPALVLFSISKDAKSYKVLKDADYFCVNVLAEDQKVVSERFAGRDLKENKFSGIEYNLTEHGSPIIDGIISYLDCKKSVEYNAGDHSLIIGEVLNGEVLRQKKPLIYYDGQYTTIISPEYIEQTTELFW